MLEDICTVSSLSEHSHHCTVKSVFNIPEKVSVHDTTGVPLSQVT